MISWFRNLFRKKSDAELLSEDWENDYVTHPWPSRIIYVHFHQGYLPDYSFFCALDAMGMWIKAVDLVLTNDLAKANIRIYPADLYGRTAGYAYFPRTPIYGGDIKIDNSNREWTPELLTSVIAHELGHALGLKHNNNPRSIMYYRIRSRKGVAKCDIDRINRLYDSQDTNTP